MLFSFAQLMPLTSPRPWPRAVPARELALSRLCRPPRGTPQRAFPTALRQFFPSSP